MARPDQLRGQVEENLRQLGRDHLDVVNLRTLSVTKPVGEHFGALADAPRRRAGPPPRPVQRDREQIDEALAIAPVVCVQNRYSIDSRRPEADDVLRACAEQGIAFVPFFAIAGDGREAGGGRPPTTTGYWPSPGRTARRPRRSGWPGRCSRAPTCWRFPEPAAPRTWPRTWRRRAAAVGGRNDPLSNRAAPGVVIPVDGPL